MAWPRPSLKGTGVVDIARLQVRIVPNQVIDFADTNQGDPETPGLEAGTYKRPRGHVHSVTEDLQVVCSCGRSVRSVLVNRMIDRKEWNRLSGTPGYHFVYDEGGMVCVATTRFVCSLEQLPEGMTHCNEAEYTRFLPVTAWLQRA
ncbi:hypothetical protein AHiyo6_00350 [Arthrobacter sp. Hiyo6]|nr:hypothetical protein AHiyo6_00350 [Arthrobacter sp. Hiyo6]